MRLNLRTSQNKRGFSSDYYLSDQYLETLPGKVYAQAGDIVPRFLKKVTESEVTLEELGGLYTRALFMALMLEALEVN